MEGISNKLRGFATSPTLNRPHKQVWSSGPMPLFQAAGLESRSTGHPGKQRDYLFQQPPHDWRIPITGDIKWSASPDKQ